MGSDTDRDSGKSNVPTLSQTSGRSQRSTRLARISLSAITKVGVTQMDDQGNAKCVICLFRMILMLDLSQRGCFCLSVPARPSCSSTLDG